ncbi:MAG: tetratricopeptide repeat protein [Saprospiraceae bacterium]
MLKNLFTLMFILLVSHVSFSQNNQQKEEASKRAQNEMLYKRNISYALNYHRQKNYVKALEKFEEAFQIKNSERIDLYNTACSASLAQNFEKASHYLNKSIDSGYIDLNWMNNDQDFVEFKKTTYWKDIIKNINNKLNILTEAFKKIKGIPLVELVPFKKDGKWGYIHKKSKKIIVEASYKAVEFGGTCLKIELTDNNFFNVDKDGNISVFRRPANYQAIDPPAPPFPMVGNAKVDTSANFKGFRVNKFNRISHVSSIYDKTEWDFLDDSAPSAPEIEILGPFKIGGKWHAVVQKNDKWGVIDEAGNIFEKVRFEFEELIPVTDYVGEDYWFYFADSLGNRGFINSLGKVKFYKEFDEYPFTTNNEMGLAILRKKNQENSVIDLTKMEWVIKPTKSLIVNIDYTYNGDCNNIPYEHRDKVIDFYFLIKDKDQEEYYIGTNNEVYKPK